MKILPVESPSEPEVITVDDVTIKYYQEPDCVSADYQCLKISTANNGTERFLILKTKRWAISDIDELIDVLKDFKIRAGITSIAT